MRRGGPFGNLTHLAEAYAHVAKILKPKEWKANKKAIAVVQEEYDKLRKRGAWDEKRVREWADVRREAEIKRKIIRKPRGH